MDGEGVGHAEEPSGSTRDSVVALDGPTHSCVPQLFEYEPK